MNIMESKLDKFEIDGVNFRTDYLLVEPPLSRLANPPICFGVDPGTKNIGLAILDVNAYLYQIEVINKPKNPVERMKIFNKLLEKYFHWHDYSSRVVIEGSIYSRTYKEDELSEMRATAVWWALKRGMNVEIIKPNTIRKKVLGNGKVKPQDRWSDLPPDAANALACAYYAMLGF